MSGLLVDGHLVVVPGVAVVSPHEQPWAFVTYGKDCKPRPRRPQQWILHKTIADDPECALPGAGATGGAERTARYWQQCDGHAYPYRNAGAHLVTGHDGVVACLADLAIAEVFHATVSNAYSVGHETCEMLGGGVHQAALDATVTTTIAGCRALGIQLQVPKLPYAGHPLKRMLNGGHDVVGVFGHRDNTEDRGRWDPGDILFDMLRAAGAESFDIAASEDLDAWRRRQADLNARGHALVIDGIPGPATTAALKADGYLDGIFALGKA